MRKILFLSLICLVVTVTLGAGCSLGGSSKSDSSKSGGIYKSADSGATWSQITAYPTAGGVGNIGTAEILSMVFDPQDNNVIYAGTSEKGLILSYDAGASWGSPQDSGLQKDKITAVVVDPKDICTVFAASETHLYKTETCGREFESVYDEARSKIYLTEITADWYNDGVLYLGLSNGDVMKSSNGGSGWTKVATLKKEITSIAISNQDSRVVLVGTEKELWKSSDAGVTWVEKTDSLKDYESADEIYSIVQDVVGSTWLLSSKYGILRSTDAGETWSNLNLLTSPGQIEIKALVVDPKDANKIYYSTASTFYSTTDGGANWDTLKFNDDGWAVSRLLIDPEETAIIYLGKEKIEE